MIVNLESLHSRSNDFGNGARTERTCGSDLGRQPRHRQGDACGLAAEGVNVVLLARRKDQLERAADDIGTGHDVNVLPITAFLASDRARYFNGSNVVLDGGLSVNPRPA